MTVCVPLTTVDERVLGLEASFFLLPVGVESDDEDAVHGDEQGRQLGHVLAAVATVQGHFEQVLERAPRLRVDVHVVGRTPAVHTALAGCITARSHFRRH